MNVITSFPSTGHPTPSAIIWNNKTAWAVTFTLFALQVQDLRQTLLAMAAQKDNFVVVLCVDQSEHSEFTFKCEYVTVCWSVLWLDCIKAGYLTVYGQTMDVHTCKLCDVSLRIFSLAPEGLLER